MGSLSPLEGLRAIIAIIGLCVAAWGFKRAPDGAMAFASPIRPIVLSRRRVLMKTYARIFGAALVQVTIAATVVDPSPLPITAWIANAALIYIGCEMVVVTLRELFGWADLERIIGSSRPLTPDPADVAIRASLDARDTMHDVNAHMTVVMGAVDLLLGRRDIASEVRSELGIVRDGLLDVRRLQFDVQTLIRSQSQQIRPIRSEDGHADHERLDAVRPEDRLLPGVGDPHGEARD